MYQEYQARFIDEVTDQRLDDVAKYVPSFIKKLQRVFLENVIIHYIIIRYFSY